MAGPDKKTLAEEKTLAADISAEHAARAAAQADADALAAVRAQVPSDSRVCPNCRGELTKHGDANPYKRGAWHCNGCGACWAPGLKTMREGHVPPTGWPPA